MTKDVLINISGLQMELDDGEPVEMMTTGDYYLKNGKHFILYDEIEDDHQVVKNILKIGPKTVEISKKGGRNSHMVFEKGKENLSYYDTPFGSLLLGVSTSDIRWMEKVYLLAHASSFVPSIKTVSFDNSPAFSNRFTI